MIAFNCIYVDLVNYKSTGIGGSFLKYTLSELVAGNQQVSKSKFATS